MTAAEGNKAFMSLGKASNTRRLQLYRWLFPALDERTECRCADRWKVAIGVAMKYPFSCYTPDPLCHFKLLRERPYMFNESIGEHPIKGLIR